MFNRLKYLYTEGFEVCSIMGYDNMKIEEGPGEGTILYRVRQTNGSWRIVSEKFLVSYDEMTACSSFYLRKILN